VTIALATDTISDIERFVVLSNEICPMGGPLGAGGGGAVVCAVAEPLAARTKVVMPNHLRVALGVTG